MYGWRQPHAPIWLTVALLLALSRPTPAGPLVPENRGRPGGTLDVSVALVDEGLQVRAVPLHRMFLIGEKQDTLEIRTDTAGHARIAVPEGRYRLSSATPVTFQGRQYFWDMAVVVSSGAGSAVSLTNDNASVATASTSPSREDVDPAARLFERFKSSVVKIEAGLAHGTGFLADTLGGVLLTNAHVVESADSNEVIVELDEARRVRGQVLATDADADVAVVRVNPGLVADRPRIPLLGAQEARLVPGEHLVAMGFPLNQDLTITTGIASSVREGAVISDVNINPGNSGGPLMKTSGEAVAINTFGDVGPRGPGVSGSILVDRARAALERARTALDRTAPPASDLLPPVPGTRLSLAWLKSRADSAVVDQYKCFTGIEVSGFDATLITPVQTFVALKAFENEVAKDRKKREARAGLSEEQRYSEVRQYRDWSEYVGSPTTPVVALSVVPRVGETGGSLFARAMISPYLQATYKFLGDVREVRVYRNGELVTPIRGGHAPLKVFQQNQWVALKDVADLGFYLFDPELLRPDSAGVAPSVVLAVRDLKSPRKWKCRELPFEAVARGWNDFENYYRGLERGPEFRLADLKRSKARKPVTALSALGSECSWTWNVNY